VHTGADVAEGFIDQTAIAGVLDQAVEGEDSVIGLTTVSDTFGDTLTKKVDIMRSGHFSRILETRRAPMSEPVQPPRECVSLKPVPPKLEAVAGLGLRALRQQPNINLVANWKYHKSHPI
jgi:hypothetical protein